MSKLRFRVVETAFKKRAAEVPAPAERPSDYFGQNVFNRAKMFKYLPEKAYERITDCIDNGAPLDRETADIVAAGMKKWAIGMGATHYTHWFHPLTEGTAEKHDAFVEHDGKGGMVEEFSGKLLIQQEPDASSFPNGGIRNTFEARGYSAWDPSSPAFIVGDTLCIPTVFIAYTGESLDYKAPLLKALEAVNKAATDVCHYFNPDVKKVYAYLGWEQEYFLVDEGLYAALVCALLIGTQQNVQAADMPECVEGSYLTNKDSSEVTVDSKSRGIYLKSGSSSITRAGTGKIAAGGNTVGQKVVSKITVDVKVERYVNGKWGYYTSWIETNYNSVYVSTSKTLSVPTGYYYRVCCVHYANSDVSDSYTDGIYI